MKIYEVIDKMLEVELREIDEQRRPVNRNSPRRPKSKTTEELIDDLFAPMIEPETAVDDRSDVLEPHHPKDNAIRDDSSTKSKWQDILLHVEGIEMTLLKYVYYVLVQHGFAQDGKDFSENWCNKNSNWYSYQTHMGRTFSLDAAISCLLSIKEAREEGEQELFKLRALEELVNLLTQFLALKYRITDIIDPRA